MLRFSDGSRFFGWGYTEVEEKKVENRLREQCDVENGCCG